MSTTKRHFVKELKEEEFIHKNAYKAVRFWDVCYTDTGGYTENEFTVHFFVDGSLTISQDSGDGFISLHGKAVKTFRALITQTNSDAA